MEVFERFNAKLVVIGNGETHYLKPFREVTGYKGFLYTDPSLTVFEHLGFKRSLISIIGLQTVRKGVQAMKEGHSQGGIQGSALQQGGALIIGPGDKVYYFHRNREPSDHPPVKELLDACEK
jgi:hypothetical protein